MRKYYKYEINTTFANILCIIITIIATVPVWNIIVDTIFNIEYKYIGIFFFIYIIWMFLHEALHGIGHMVCGVKINELSFGALLEKSILFCLVRREVSKKNILISLIFPFIFIGLITYIIGILINCPLLIILSILNIGGACMDIIMFIQFIKLGSDITYIEPGDGTSFYIMSNNEIKKLVGLTKKEEGIYQERMFSNLNNKFIDVSKISIIIMILFVVLSGILIIL